MEITFLGATGTVTGSRYLVRHGGATVLVDCGLFQGFKQLRLRNRSPLPVEPGSIDAVVLTHAHLDHSGWLPVLVRDGFRGRVHCSSATASLARILLPDSGGLLEEEAAYANRKGFSKHAPATPLYTRDDALRSLKRLAPQPWHRPFEVGRGLSCTLVPAGHMLGASIVRIEDGGRSLVFSGDLGRPNDLLLNPPERVAHADALVVESTYGDRAHGDADPLDTLADAIARTAARGGTVLIPSFAVGRAQAILWAIRLLKDARRIPELPVYLNSPMADDARRAYSRHVGEHRLSREQCDALAEVATIVATPDESRALNARRGPMVIVASSGMATGGRVVHHLKTLAPDHRNTILFAGYQAGGTRGGALVAGARSVRIHGQDVPVRAEVATIDGLSAHADAGEIVDWLRGFEAPPATTFVTHGEPGPADAMRQRIERTLGWNVRVPEWTEAVPLW